MKGLKGLNKEKLKSLMSLDVKELAKRLKKSSSKGKTIKPFDKKVLSFDIGSENIKIVVGRYYKGNLTVENLITIPTPEDAVLDGNILNSIAVENAILDALKLYKINVKDAICTTNSTLIINREIVIPKVEEEEEETLIGFEIQRYLPLNMDDYIVQHYVLDTMEVDNKLKSKALVVTYPHKMARSYYNLLLNLKLKPRVLDVEYNSLSKLVNYAKVINGIEYSIQDTLAFIDMGSNTLNVNIYKDGKLQFTRIIKSGGNNIDFHLSKVMGKSLKEAEKYKIEKANLLNGEEDPYMEPVKEVVEEWISELDRIFQFYKNKNQGNYIDRIYLYGGCARLNGMEEILSAKYNAPVERVKTINNIKFNGSDLGDYLNSLGAIITR